MKMLVFTVCMAAAAAFSIRAAPIQGALQVELGPGEFTLAAQPQPVNEVTLDDILYSGIAVQVFKDISPLQLVNPLAPAKSGDGEQNVVRDSVTGKVVGLKFFAVNFW